MVTLLVTAAGCGSPDAGADASPTTPDASDAAPCDFSRCGGECVDTSSDPDHCGACSAACTPSQSCESSSCECPDVMLDEESLVLTEMDPDMLAPTILGVGAYADGDQIHAFVVGYLSPETPIDTDIDLSGSATGEAPFVGVGYDVDFASREPRSTFTSTAGTLRLSRRCPEGVAGSATDAVVVEVDPTTEPATVLEGGCALALPALTFDFGGACR